MKITRTSALLPLAVVLPLTLSACGGSSSGASGSTSMTEAVTTSEDATTSAAPALPSGTYQVDDGSSNNAATMSVSQPIGLVSIPRDDQGNNRVSAVLITMNVVAGDLGSLTSAGGVLDRDSTPDDAEAFGATEPLTSTDEGTAVPAIETSAAATLCKGKSLDADLGSLASNETVCYPFAFSSAAPVTNVYWSLDTSEAQWTLTFPKGTAVARKALASFSGSGSKLLTIPDSARNGTVTVTWKMPSGGNNIIEAESDTAGSDLKLITNVIGANDGSDPNEDLSEAGYFQVISEGSWTVTVTE